MHRLYFVCPFFDKLMKIVLVFPPFYLEPMYNLPPLGLINLATALKGSVHQVVLIDFVLAIRRGTLRMSKNIYRDCAHEILNEKPDIIGFSAQCTTYPGVIRISKEIKDKQNDVKIVIGGHNASFVDRITLERFPFVDAIVRGEGEITFKKLVDRYESGENAAGVAGVTFRCGDKIVRNKDRDLIPNLDELPFPDYSFLPPFSEYRDACNLPRSIAILEVGRGCPHNCIYCSESILWRRTTRTISVSRLVCEMENLFNNFYAECFLLSYDQFTVKRSFVESFCYRVIEQGLNHLPWYCISRLDSVDAPLLKLMREAGCESMCYGIDSGSKKTLAFIRKNINREILCQRVVETSDQGIIPTLSFIIGFPEEEKEDIDETLCMALKTGIVGNNNPLIQMPTVLPGTDLANRYGELLVRGVDTYFALGLEFDGGKRIESDEKLINSDPAIFSSFYNLPCPGRSLEELNLIATCFPLIVKLYPKTFLLLSLECHRSVSDLFIGWLNWLKIYLKREACALSPQECYLYFRDFISDMLRKKRVLERKHFPDILKYENLALEVGKFTPCKNSFHIDPEQIREFRPLKSKNMIIENFAFNIPEIIMDFTSGAFEKEYPPQKTLLLFKQDDELLNVLEINSFAGDLLDLCDGKKEIGVISQELYGHYGLDVSPGDFYKACVEAINVFGKRGCLNME